ncbi:MucB/RseB C-terminal domain-containing protein [Acidiferrobacter sp.]|uniref:MucB/RseB C-terminal domain-containing protein n=1 Tax=Acidiferrobacter sp. TaxID=1872107 RepID=UPI00261C0A46|nr:MucB/RseB C-terminal domain-containing protein [Acidiferrobacter sp.]
MRGWRPLWTAGLVLASGAAFAGSARAFLNRMQDAAHTLDYTGTFVYRHDGLLSAMHIVHRVAHGRVTERLTTLDGRRQVIIRQHGQITCYLPHDRVEFVEQRAMALKTFPALIPTHLKPLRRFYAIHLGGLGRVAGMAARLVVIDPRDRYRYGYRLWADRKNGLLLKAAIINDKDKTIEQFLFIRLHLHRTIPASAVGPIGIGHASTYKKERGELFFDPTPTWTVTKVPPGFRLAMHLMRRMAGHKGIVQHLVYSDGLAGVSVFIGRRVQGVPVHAQLFRLGALHVFRTVVDHRMVTALGDVPTVTVETMALSVRPLAQRPQARRAPKG